MPIKRVFLIVLDSLGIGKAPDASEFCDEGADTLKSISSSEHFRIPNLMKLGVGEIDGLDYLRVCGEETGTDGSCCGLRFSGSAVGRLSERSKGKDTTIGHWEISGIVSEKPLPVYPQGFPDEIIAEFERLTGRKTLCNKPYSGTDVIKDYGEEHIKTGALIIYTSADSVFQIAAHEDVVPVDLLYEYCRIARRLLVGRHGVGRVIARPFTGEYPFARTPRRHDFSIEPPERTVLEAIKESGRECIAVGKINDIFAGKGITEFVHTNSNTDGMEKALSYAKRDFEGLCFINLVDFDMVYGHRNDVDGYAVALSEFDAWLPSFAEVLSENDLLIITADHGCDPGFKGTDHTREGVPLIIVKGGASISQEINALNLGSRDTFADIAATVSDIWNLDYACNGESIVPAALGALAVRAADNAYSPYSRFCVGAVVLAESGKVYTGCNVENASFGAAVCAERVAVCKAISAGERRLSAVAVAGGRDGIINGACYPCGICRQTLAEFCEEPSKFKVVTVSCGLKHEVYTLEELFAKGFTSEAIFCENV